jgi:hypothetical protein
MAALVAIGFHEHRGIDRELRGEIADLAIAAEARVEISSRHDRCTGNGHITRQATREHPAEADVPRGVAQLLACSHEAQAFTIPHRAAEFGALHGRWEKTAEPARR